jgi:hypothetical protein
MVMLHPHCLNFGLDYAIIKDWEKQEEQELND